MDLGIRPLSPEFLLAAELLEIIAPGGFVDPRRLRELILKRWDRISTLAHAIHDAKPKEKTTREKLTPGKLVSTERVTHRDIAGNETVTTTEFFTVE